MGGTGPLQWVRFFHVLGDQDTTYQMEHPQFIGCNKTDCASDTTMLPGWNVLKGILRTYRHLVKYPESMGGTADVDVGGDERSRRGSETIGITHNNSSVNIVGFFREP